MFQAVWERKRTFCNYKNAKIIILTLQGFCAKKKGTIKSKTQASWAHSLHLFMLANICLYCTLHVCSLWIEATYGFFLLLLFCVLLLFWNSGGWHWTHSHNPGGWPGTLGSPPLSTSWVLELVICHHTQIHGCFCLSSA